jgi:type III pantothenate kinase
MAVVLYLDVGNTACKWRLRNGMAKQEGRIVHQGSWERMLALLPQVKPDRLYVASVAGKQADAQLASVLSERLGRVADFHYTQARCLGVTCAYETPARLGVDRWLGVIEAHARYGGAIVVDSGSALTIDAVTSMGQHVGGYIVPGLALMRQSLKLGTADIQMEGGVPPGMEPGRSTTTAVEHGILRMTVAFITDAVVALRKQLADTCITAVTGGDAGHLLPRLDETALGTTIHYHADLVLDGLERVADANEES